MTEEKLCGGKTFKEVMEEVNFHIYDKHKIEQLQKENAELKEQIEKMKSDVYANIKWADQNKNNEMWKKLIKMMNEWE